MELWNRCRTPIEELIDKVRRKSPETQIVIGAATGFAAAVASMRIAKTAAFLIGGGLLAASLLTDFIWNPQLNNLHFNVDQVSQLISNNLVLTTGFLAGYLLGFSYS